MVARKGHSHPACSPYSPAFLLLCCIFLLWLATGCAGLYFYAHDYASWVSTVMVFRNTSILKDTGWLQLNPYTNATVGRALYKTTFQMQNSTNGSLSSFNTSFDFSMNTDRGKEYFGDGFAFLICPNPFRGDDLQVSSGGYLGMFNSSTNGLLKNRVFAVEFDTHQNAPFKDPNDNHIGVDLNSVISLRTNNLSTFGIILNEGKKIICWVDYDGEQRYLWVYLALAPANKPSKPAIKMALDLAPYMKDNMYVGFTSATGTRAELHTVYSWWFLAGFGNLTLPLSPSSSTRPLARFGQRKAVIGIFSLAVMVGFLCILCIFGRRRWQRQSKHLIDILLPVACWMYWKESITCEVRSTRCLKLAKPTVELLAWLWRTRLARKCDQLHVKTWPEMLLKRKVGPYYRGEAWQLEYKKQKRRKPHGAVHVLLYESNDKESSGDERDSPGRVKVIKHIHMFPLAERKVEEVEVSEVEEEIVDPLPAAVGKQGGSDKDSKSYLVTRDSFIVLEESEVELFQRRGSFLIPQGVPVDGQQKLTDPRKDVSPAIPVVAKPQARSPQMKAGLSEVKLATGDMQLQPEAFYMSTEDASSDKLFRRRGSFLVCSEDAIGFMGTTSSTGVGRNDPAVQHFIEYDPYGDFKRGFDVAAPCVQSPQKAGGSSKVNSVAGDVRLRPETTYLFSDDSSSPGFHVRRGSFLVRPEDAIGLMGTASTLNEGEANHPALRHSVEDSESKSGMDITTRHATSHAGSCKSKLATGHVHTRPETTYISTEHCSSPQFLVRRGSFVVHPEDAANLMGAARVNEPSGLHLVEHDANVGDSKRRADVRRGSLMMLGVEHDVVPMSREHETKRGSCLLVEGASSSSKPESRDEGNRTALQEGSSFMSGVDCLGDRQRGTDLRRGSFIVLEEDAASSSKPGARHQAKESAGKSEDDGLQSELSNQSPESPQHPLSSANEDSKSHVVHRWLFE